MASPISLLISKRSLPFLTIDAIIGNQAFSQYRCINISSGLSYNYQANNVFLNSLRKDDVEAQVEFTLKVMESARVTFY